MEGGRQGDRETGRQGRVGEGWAGEGNGSSRTATPNHQTKPYHLAWWLGSGGSGKLVHT